MSSYYFSETIKEQLKHDAPYAWFLYRQSEKSSLFKKENIETLKEKLDAYMDCFILSEKADDSLLDDFLNLDDWGASYVMAKVALVCNDEERLNQVVENIDEQEKSKELKDMKIRYTGVLLKEEKKEERDSSIPTIHLKSKQIAPKTGRYQATLAKGHPKEEWLRNSGFDIKTVKLGKNIGTFGFDESEADIVWKYLGE